MAGRHRNNLLAGAFTLGSLLLAVFALIWIGRVWESFTVTRVPYIFRFTIRDGAAGLEKGSVVKVGGQQVGNVTKVQFDWPGDPKQAPADARNYLYVSVSVDSTITLHRNAAVYLEQPLLGSVSQINIPDLGGPRPGIPEGDDRAAQLAQGAIIDASIAPPSFLAQAGYDKEQATQLQNILRRGSDIGDRLGELSAALQARLPKTIDGVDATVDNARSLTTALRDDYREQYRDRLTAIFENLRVGTVSVNDAVGDSRRLLASVQDAVNANRPFLDKIFLSTSDLTAKLNDELYGRVLSAMTTGEQAVRDVADITARARRLLTEESPNLRRAMADARLAADQLKLTLIEVRRNPWRLLYQPTKKELAEELLYDSARSYADAISDLRAAGEALEAAMAAQKAGTAAESPDRARLAELAAELQAALERYKTTEQKFTDRVLRGADR